MKILVLQLKRIGDLVLTTPALRALRKHLVDARITLLVEHGSRELLPAIDYIDEHLVFNRVGNNRALWRRLTFASFDVCLDFTGTDRSAFFSLLSKAKMRASFSSVQNSAFRWACYNRFIDSPTLEFHTIDHYLHLLRALKIETHERGLALNLPERALKKADQLRNAYGSEERFALLHPGTARPEKYWLPERWAAVIDYCRRELDLTVALTGSREAVEEEHLAKIKSRVHCADLSGRVDLLSLAALAGRADLFLSVDSGPMHVAASTGVAQVALFGPTNPFHWAPRHPRTAVVVAGESTPNPPLAPRREKLPMSQISTQQVIDGIRSVIF